jgi:hypothetical protein
MEIHASAQWIAEHADHVSIQTKNLGDIAAKIGKRMQERQYDRKQWKAHPLHPTIHDQTIHWIFLMDLLNFSFWPERSHQPRYTVTWQGTAYTGYWSLCAMIWRNVEEGIPIVDPTYYATASSEVLEYALRPDPGCDPIPLLKERVSMMHRAGALILQVS